MNPHDDTTEPMTPSRIVTQWLADLPEDTSELHHITSTEWQQLYAAINSLIEQEKRAYLQSVLRSRAKTNPDATIKELYEGLYEQKHEYRAAQLKKGTQ